MPRAFGQLAPHQGELLLQERDLGGEIVGVLLPSCGARLRVVAACHVPPPRGLERCVLTLTADRPLRLVRTRPPQAVYKNPSHCYEPRACGIGHDATRSQMSGRAPAVA